MCLLHPNRKPHWPAPGELRASPFRGRLRSARFARLHSAAPGRGAQIVKSPITEETLHPQPTRLISQMLFQPICTPHPGHGVIICFPNATLSDVNATQIASGFLYVRLRPEVVSEISLLLIGQLLQPFKGSFDLNVNGSYTISPPSNLIEVVADDIAATNICPA